MSQSGGNLGPVGSEKAYFTHDDKGANFFVQFNPKSFDLDEKATWTESDQFHVDKPLLEFSRGQASSLSMELIFDTTDSGEDVREQWTRKLAGFLSVTIPDGEVAKGGKRPPRCTFTWGKFEFPCVIETMKTSFIMFSSDGKPLRAKVALTMKERSEDEIKDTATADGVTLSAPVSTFGGRSNSRTEAARIGVGSGNAQDAAAQSGIAAGTQNQQSSDFSEVSTYEVQEGDTLTSIALSLSIEFWWIAAANNISDPMNLEPGTSLVIPPSKQVAEIFQHLPAEDPWYWGDYDPELNENSDLADIFAIYDGSWDPFAEQELEDLGAETALEVGTGDQVSGDWAMSEYEGQAPDATTFEHGESGSSDVFSIYAPPEEDEEEEAEGEVARDVPAPPSGSPPVRSRSEQDDS